MKFPNLTTSRLTLSQLNEEDTPAVFSIFSHPEVIKFYDLAAYTKEEQASELISLFNQRFNDDLGIRWAIRLNTTGELIGTCGFAWQQGMRSASIGYESHPDFWSKGYISEALNKTIETAYSDKLHIKGLNRIQADVITGNIASEMVLQKLGFKLEGIRRESGFWKDKFHDLNCYSLLKKEFGR